MVHLKRVFIPMYYFQIGYDAQVRGSYVHEEQQRGLGALLPSFHLHSSGNTTVFSECFPTDSQKEADYSINGKLPLHLQKGAAYCTDMQQFSALNQDVRCYLLIFLGKRHSLLPIYWKSLKQEPKTIWLEQMFPMSFN